MVLKARRYAGRLEAMLLIDTRANPFKPPDDSPTDQRPL